MNGEWPKGEDKYTHDLYIYIYNIHNIFKVFNGLNTLYIYIKRDIIYSIVFEGLPGDKGSQTPTETILGVTKAINNISKTSKTQ